MVDPRIGPGFDRGVRAPSWVTRGLLPGLLAAGCQGQTEQHQVNVSPSNYDFGPVQVGVPSPPRLVTVTRVNSDNLTTTELIDGIDESCPDFLVQSLSQVLPAAVSQTCEFEPGLGFFCFPEEVLTFEVVFQPTGPGLRSCVFTVDNADPGIPDRVFTMQGTGLSPPADITLVQPVGGALDFGAVTQGGPSSWLTVTVRNDGSTRLRIDNALQDLGWFGVNGLGSGYLDPGESAVWFAACRPRMLGPGSGIFRINSNDVDEPTVLVTLACTGVDSMLEAAPSPIQFAPTLAGAVAEVTIDVSNIGSAPLTGLEAVVSGDYLTLAAGPGQASLAPAEATTVRVQFAPQAHGDVLGTLDLRYDGGTRAVPISAPGRTAAFSLTPDGEVDLGPVCAGQPTATPHLFVLVGTGTGDFELESATVDGGFTVSPNGPSWPTTVGAAGSSTATFSVFAAPANPGPMTGTLTLSTSIPGRATHDVVLSALGVPAGIGVTPAAFDAGVAVIGSSSGGRPITLSNCGGAPITVQSVSIDGANAAEFAIAMAPASLTAGNAETLTWQVELRPVRQGDKVATLHVVYDGGVLDVPLTGIALDDSVLPPPPEAERGSYCACSAGGSGAGGTSLLAVVLGLVVARRRRARA